MRVQFQEFSRTRGFQEAVETLTEGPATRARRWTAAVAKHCLVGTPRCVIQGVMRTERQTGRGRCVWQGGGGGGGGTLKRISLMEG